MGVAFGSLHNLRDEQDFYYIQYESYEQCFELYDRLSLIHIFHRVTSTADGTRVQVVDL